MNCTGKKFGYTACNIFVDTTDNPTCNEYDNPATDRTGVKTDAVKDYGKYRYEYGSGTPDDAEWSIQNTAAVHYGSACNYKTINSFYNVTKDAAYYKYPEKLENMSFCFTYSSQFIPPHNLI